MLCYVMLYILRHLKEKTNHSKTNKHVVLCFIGNTLDVIQTNACLSLCICGSLCISPIVYGDEHILFICQ